jgi:hypothetical protein
MTKNELKDIAEILNGYEAWKIAKLRIFDSGYEPLTSVSAYLDDYAKQRALDTLEIIQSMYPDGGVTVAEALGIYGEIGVLVTGRSQFIEED